MVDLAQNNVVIRKPCDFYVRSTMGILASILTAPLLYIPI